MKRFNFVHVLSMLVLVVIFASCGFTQPGYGEDYSDRPVRSRQIYSDPYYGNATTIVRDPYTGRYYEVTPVGPYGYDTYSAPYGSTYGNSRYYGRGNSRGYSNNSPRRSQTVTQPQQQQQRGSSETINKAKNIIRKD